MVAVEEQELFWNARLPTPAVEYSNVMLSPWSVRGRGHIPHSLQGWLYVVAEGCKPGTKARCVRRRFGKDRSRTNPETPTTRDRARCFIFFVFKRALVSTIFLPTLAVVVVALPQATASSTLTQPSSFYTLIPASQRRYSLDVTIGDPGRRARSVGAWLRPQR